jgi:hypothetical protein
VGLESIQISPLAYTKPSPGRFWLWGEVRDKGRGARDGRGARGGRVRGGEQGRGKQGEGSKGSKEKG